MHEQNNHLREQIYLAALLHDIGKFYQRADDSGTSKSKLLTAQTKQLESMLCPLGKNGFYTHKHVLWTAQFLYNFEPHFKNLLNKSGVAGELEFIRLAASHHHPDGNSIPGKIIQKADHYSSGIDRSKNEGLVDEKDQESWDSFKKKRMCSIFEGLHSPKPQYTFRLPLSEIALDESFFPQKNLPGDPDYKTLWEKFETEVKFIQSDNFRSFSETMMALLQKYTSTIPSSTMHLPDVSLFDHSKTVAAFAVCLHDYLMEKNGLSQFDIAADEEAFLLIGADVSGIQKFIYEIVSQNAAKNLKGRSFYLQLLVDSILEKILNELNLFNANVVYASGGGFYIIAPNTKLVKDKLAVLEETLSEKIYETHKSSLFLAFDNVAFSEAHLFNQEINIPWQQLIEKLDRKKQQRHINQMINAYDDFFEPQDFGGEQITDSITGEEIKHPKQVVYLDKDSGSKTQPVHVLTYDQIELGKMLKKAKYRVSTTQKLNYWKAQPFDPCRIGIFHYLVTKQEIGDNRKNLKSSADRVTIRSINDMNFLESAISGTENTYNFDFYGGSDFPVAINKQGEEEPKTFDMLAGDDAASLKRLGILRMDVDNLGQAFISGFKDNKKTFSRYSALSRSLDYFFRGYLNTVWKQEKFKDHTFIIYAGGDDLFVVGKWTQLTEMAEQIRNDFKAWSCNNPHLSLSGGIAAVTPKFPVMKGALLGEAAEKAAKDHTIKINDKLKLQKNAFTLLNMPLNWDHEFPIVKKFKKELSTMIANEELPAGFLQKVLSLYYSYLEQKEKQQNPRWRWMIAYDFSRAKGRLKSEAAKQFLDEIKLNIFTNSLNNEKINSNYEFIELFALASRWAELEKRS
jgi:CRISPR-associated protein Csm1